MNSTGWRALQVLIAGLIASGFCLAAQREDAAPQAEVAAKGGKQAPTQATFGGSIFRNMVNVVDKNVPTSWSVEEGKFENVKWVAELGNNTHGTLVVYGGRVFIGTNNFKPRDPKIKGDKAILMCFAEKDGAFLWQNVHDAPPPDIMIHLEHGLCSTPTVEGDFIYYCTPSCVLVCAKTADGKIVWQRDMMKDLKVIPRFVCACSPLVVDDMVFVVTGNGKDEEGKLPAPKAPSFAAFRKNNGELLWQSNLPGDKIIEGQWSSPVYAVAKGKPQVIFPGGDGYLYALEPKTGSLIWKFQCSPEQTKADRGIRQTVAGLPVVDGERLYVAVGSYPKDDAMSKIGHLYSIDITKTGDVSCKNENFDPQDPANKGSALVWHYGGINPSPPPKGRQVRLHGCGCTPAVHDGLIYVAEVRGYLQCLDAKTGQQYWEHDFKSEVFGSPYWVDGRVYVCVGDGECKIFEHGKQYKRPRGIDMQAQLESTPVVANGVLFIGTETKIYAIAGK